MVTDGYSKALSNIDWRGQLIDVLDNVDPKAIINAMSRGFPQMYYTQINPYTPNRSFDYYINKYVVWPEELDHRNFMVKCWVIWG